MWRTTAIEPDHVGQRRHIVIAPEGQADALKQAEDVELAVGIEIVEHLVGGKLVHPDHDAGAQVAERLRQRFELRAGHRLQFGERGGFRARPRRYVFGKRLVLGRGARVRHGVQWGNSGNRRWS